MTESKSLAKADAAKSASDVTAGRNEVGALALEAVQYLNRRGDHEAFEADVRALVDRVAELESARETLVNAADANESAYIRESAALRADVARLREDVEAALDWIERHALPALGDDTDGGNALAESLRQAIAATAEQGGKS